MTAHSVPLHCCYCGGEDLFPHAGDGLLHGGVPQHGAWECRECLRAFSVRFIGLLAPPTPPPSGVPR
ncbi:MAG: hypothetical protein M3Q87_01165 [Actinomycetota bacterium]|nr:hypothetical protein [Actinomycetota bacterium]